MVCGLDVNSVKCRFPFLNSMIPAGRGGAEANGTSAKVFSLLKDYMVHDEFAVASVHHIFYFFCIYLFSF